MDTKERRRAKGPDRPNNTKTAPPRRRARSPERVPKPRRLPERVARAPKPDIPEAVYTMPQPFRRGKFLLRLASVAAVVAALMMALSVFFRVDTVTVLGAEKYTPAMILEASGIENGEALLTMSKARAAGKIQTNLPYVDEVKISIELPGTVHIEVRELDVAYAIAAADNSWWLISADGTALEPVDAAGTAEYTRILGVEAAVPTPGAVITAAPEAAPTEETEASEETSETGETEAVIPTQTEETGSQRLSAVLRILQGLESCGIVGEVSSIDVQNLIDIQMHYDQRLQVKLGSAVDLEYKLDYLAQAVRQMEDYQTGILDLTFEYGQQGIFTPES